MHGVGLHSRIFFAAHVYQAVAAWLKEPAVESSPDTKAKQPLAAQSARPQQRLGSTECAACALGNVVVSLCGISRSRRQPKQNREAEGLFSPVAVKNLGDFTCLPPGSWPTHMQRDVICTWVGRPLLRLQEFSTVSTGFAPQFAAEGRACSICSKEIWADAATIQCVSWHGAGCDLEFRCPGKPVSR